MGLRWFLITWTTHGSWLPGDPRGFRTHKRKLDITAPKRYSDSQDKYDSRDWQGLLEYSKRICKGEIVLNKRQQDFVRSRTPEIAAQCNCEVMAIHVGHNHVHVVVRPGETDIVKVVKRIKGVTSRELSHRGLEGRVWTRGYHMRIIPEEAVPNVVRYLSSHR